MQYAILTKLRRKMVENTFNADFRTLNFLVVNPCAYTFSILLLFLDPVKQRRKIICSRQIVGTTPIILIMSQYACIFNRPKELCKNFATLPK